MIVWEQPDSYTHDEYSSRPSYTEDDVTSHDGGLRSTVQALTKQIHEYELMIEDYEVRSKRPRLEEEHKTLKWKYQKLVADKASLTERLKITETQYLKAEWER